MRARRWRSGARGLDGIGSRHDRDRHVGCFVDSDDNGGVRLDESERVERTQWGERVEWLWGHDGSSRFREFDGLDDFDMHAT